MLEDLPDLARPMALQSGTVYGSFGIPGVAVAMPDRLLLAHAADGSPGLLITKIRETGGQPSRGRLTVGVVVDTDLPSIGRQLVTTGVPMRLVPALTDDGVLEATCLGMVQVRQIGPDILTRARAEFELTDQQTLLVWQAVHNGGFPCEIRVRLAHRAVAQRLPLVATFDRQLVASVLAEHSGENLLIDADNLAALFDSMLGSEITVTGDEPTPDAAVRASTIALRLLDRFAAPEPVAALVYRLRPAAEMPPGTERVDFAEPTAVTVHRLLTLDPVTATRVLAVAADRLTKEIELPAVPAGHVRLTVTANLTQPIAGLAALGADIQIPPHPVTRPQAVEVSVPLIGPDLTQDVTLAVDPGDAIAGRARLRASLEGAPGPAELSGEWQQLAFVRSQLGPSAFPLPLTVVNAPVELTKLAAVEVRSADDSLVSRIDALNPVEVIPRAPGREPLRIVIRPIGTGRVIEIPLTVAPRVDLDPTTLPGFGAQRAQLTGGAVPTVIEWLPEGADESSRQQVRLSPDRPTVEIGWVATSPFQPGVRWRDSGRAGSWSQPVLPAPDLVIVVGPAPGNDTVDTVEVDGVALTAESSEPGVWTYLPPGPLLDRSHSGSPAIGLIDAGPVAFLQLTARLDLQQDAREVLLSALKSHRPTATVVRSTRIVVDLIGLEAHDSDGAWVQIARSTSSGTAPWTAAMSAALTPAQQGPVKAALTGIRDKLRLRAVFTVPAPPIEIHRSIGSGELVVESSSGRVEVSTRSSSSTGSAGAPRTVEQIADVADLLNPS